MAETIDWGFPSGTWEEAEAQVGEVIGSFAGPDAVSHADIRRRLEVMEWDCPLHYDEGVFASTDTKGSSRRCRCT